MNTPAARFLTVLVPLFALAAGPDPSVAADDSTIHACVSRDGKPRIVGDTASCSGNERSLSWSSGRSAGSPSLHVVDGNGENVGPVVHVEDPLFDANGQFQRRGAPLGVDAAYQIDDRVFLLRFLSIEPYLDGTSRVFFESCDCSGEPLIRLEPAGMLGRLFTPSAVGAFHQLYLARADAGEAQRTAVCSLLTADTGCEPVADGGGSPEEIVVPAEHIGQLPFVEPYHVEGTGLRNPLGGP